MCFASYSACVETLVCTETKALCRCLVLGFCLFVVVFLFVLFLIHILLIMCQVRNSVIMLRDLLGKGKKKSFSWVVGNFSCVHTHIPKLTPWEYLDFYFLKISPVVICILILVF